MATFTPAASWFRTPDERRLPTSHPEIGCQGWTRTRRRSELWRGRPTPCGLTNRRATLTPPGNGTAGRTSTCIVPLRRRVPYVFGHGSIRNGQRGRNCTCDPSVPGRVRWLLRYALIGGPEGNCTLNPPADNGALRFLSYESEMACRDEAWRRTVMPAFALRATARQPSPAAVCSGRRLVGSAGNAPVVASSSI